MNKSILQKMFKPALILYATRTLAAIIIVFPAFVFISSKFGNSNLADNFWPVPTGLSLLELMWQGRETLYIILPLAFLIGVVYFLLNQFIYGGIYDLILNKEKLIAVDFFSSCSRYSIGFIKIALAGILGFLAVILAADLLGLLFGKIAAWIAGKTIGRFVTYLVVFMGIYLFLGYLVSLRFIQVADGKPSLRNALKRAKDVFAERVRYFVALNTIAGVFSFITIVIALFLMSLIYKLNFNPLTIIILVLAQQLIILWICMLEVFQIYINRRFIKETENGT